MIEEGTQIMAGEQAFAAIDVGTTKVCALIADVDDEGRLQILGAGVALSRGLRKGIVVNIDETVEAIRAAVDYAERSSGIQINSAHIGIAGGHIGSLNNRGVVAISRHDRLIRSDDVIRVMESARTVQVPSNREILHVVPRSYTLDGQEGVKNPLGMHALRLDVEAHIVTAAATSIQNLTKCVERVGIEVEALVLQPLASAEAVLTPEEREMGVVVADIGGGTTDLAILLEGSIWHTSILPVGGYHLTNDVAIGLRMPFAAAEEIKLTHGHALPGAIDGSEQIDAASFGMESSRTLLRRQLAEILNARVEELTQMIHTEIKRSGYDGLLPAGLVITGGSANLTGIEFLARDILQLPVRIGTPRGIHGVVEAVDDPAYSTVIGLLLWSLRHTEIDFQTRPPESPLGQTVRKLGYWVRELLPQ